MASTTPLTVDTFSYDDFHLGPRFTELRPIGYGANGLVVAATDGMSGQTVAVKRLVAGGDDDRRCRQVLREMRILRRLSHENVVKVHSVLTDGGRPLAADGRNCVVYIVQELMATDLEQLMACGGRLTEEHICLLFYQLLRALKYVHSANVLHRDVKPANLLVDPATLLLKLADFSLARVLDPAYCHQGHLTQTMGTSWYRAPELLLASRRHRPGTSGPPRTPGPLPAPGPPRTPGPPPAPGPGPSYTSAVDIWAAGCVLGAMLRSGRPLLAGASDTHQLRLIIDAVTLAPDDWRHLLAVMPNRVLRKHPMRVCRPLASRCHNASPAACDLLKRLMTFSAARRMTAEQAMSHPFVAQYRCATDEPVAQRPLCIEWEVDTFQSSELRELIYNESLLSPRACGSCVCHPPSGGNTPGHAPSEGLAPGAPPGAGRTLDEILRLDGDTTVPSSVALRNLRNRGDWGAGLIEDVRGGVEGGVRRAAPVKTKSQTEVSWQEKDVADISWQKHAEDLEVERAAHSGKGEVDELVPQRSKQPASHRGKQPASHRGKQPASQNPLDEPFSRLALNPERGNKDDGNEKSAATTPPPQRRKAGRKRAPRGGRSEKEALSSVADLDDRYRLPTAHLRRDCDYSNERLKRYYGGGRGRGRGRRRQDGGASYPPTDERDDGSDRTEPHTQRDCDTYLTARRGASTGDTYRRITTLPRGGGGVPRPTPRPTPDSSSPDELPPSLHRQTGARPKKLTKKQRAL